MHRIYLIKQINMSVIAFFFENSIAKGEAEYIIYLYKGFQI